MEKKIFIIPLILISSIFCFNLVSSFSGSGDGSSGDPFQITNCTQLQEMNDDLASNYILITNINCSDTINWNSGDGFIPIGYGDAGGEYFQGIFDGQGYIISDLYMNNVSRINNPSEIDTMGLFGFVDGSVAKILNVNLENVNITGYDNTGGLVGLLEYGANIIDNCSVSGTIIGNNNVGGLVGNVYELNLINNSYTSVTVTGLENVGGLVGLNTGLINNSYSTGNVYAPDVNSVNIGGLVGWNNGGIIDFSYSTAEVTGEDTVGGLVGGNDLANITNSWSSGNVYATSTAGGFVGAFQGGYLDNCSVSGSVIGGDTWIGGFAGMVSGDFFILNSNSTGNAEATGDYVGGFTGRSVNTNAYSVINNSYATGNVTGANYVGGFLGQEETGGLDINNSYATGNVTATGDYVGGLVGQKFYGIIYNSYSTGDVIGGAEVGGLAGYAGGNIDKSYSTGNVIASGNDVGGFLGWLNNNGAIINNSYSANSVNGNSNIGGFIGTFGAGNVINSYSIGDVNGTDYVGGFVGYLDNGLIINSYSTRSVTGINYIGGFAGVVYNGEVNNSYSIGLVSGTSFIGGFIGDNDGGIPSINNCFWDTETSNQLTSYAGTGKTTAEMKNITTFSNAGWEIIESELDLNNGYPYLGWQDNNGTIWLIMEAEEEPNPFLLIDCELSGWIANSTYTLQNDIFAVGTCFNIDADNVTLDFNGFNITGDGTGYGINITGRNNITVKNGAIYGFDRGITVYNMNISSIDNMTLNSNNRGLYITSDQGPDDYFNNFTNLIIDSNSAQGIYVSYTDYSYFENISLSNNFPGGLYYNGDGAISLQGNSQYNTFNNITSSSNSIGFNLMSAYNTIITNSILSDSFNLYAESYGGIYITNTTFSGGLIYTYNGASGELNNITSDGIVRFRNSPNWIINNSNLSNIDQVGGWANSNDVRIYKSNGDGSIYFSQLVNNVVGNIDINIVLSNNYAYLNNASLTGLDIPTNITFYNMPQNFTNPAIFRDGQLCNDCIAFTSLNDQTVKFQVPGWSEYEIGEAPDTTPPYFADSFEWLPNSTINSTLNNYFWTYVRPNVFNISDNWYAIVGNWTGTFTGFQWENGQWVYNSTITSGLSGTSYASTPNVFSGNFMGVDGTWMIAGGYYSTLYGYKWNGYGWTANSTLITGLIARNSIYSNDHATPNVFQIGNDWYFLNGHYSGLLPEYAGFAWNGSQWLVNSTITNGYPIDGATITVSTFDWQGDKYMVMGGLTANTFFKNFRIWNGTGWDMEFELNATGFSPEYHGPSITPSAYVKDGNLYLIEGGGNALYGYSFEPFIGLPNDSSFFYGNESLMARFNGEDDVGFITYSVNDSRFTISSIGLLTETSALSPDNYQVNVTITDTAGNINWTIHNVEVKINPGPCNVYINQTSHFVWTDCSSPYQMYVNGTPIFNASTINLGAGYYNITVQRNDAVNYTNTVDTDFLDVPTLVDPCSIYFDKANPQMYPDSYTVYTDCSTAYNLSKDGVPISNGTTYTLPVGTSNFTVQRTDTANYTYIYDTELFSIIPNNAACSVLFDKTSPLTYPESFNVWTNCNTAFTLFRDGTPISNYSGQALNAGTYNFSVQRTDTSNYSNTYSSSLFTIVEADEGHRGASEGTFIEVSSPTTGANIFGTLGTNTTNISNFIDLSKLEDIDGKEILANLREWFRTHQWAYIIVGMLLIGGLISLLNRK